jgi:hypothetical protein
MAASDPIAAVSNFALLVTADPQKADIQGFI